MIIDLRSDTVTKPGKAMLEAMFNAQVGDDVYEEDPTVKALEEKTAGMFGKEAGLFCPSGTMTNQIAIKLHTQPGDEVICDKSSHIYLYEGGGVAFNSSASLRLLNGDRGRITAQDVLDNINPDNVHNPVTTLVSLENTCNKGGGCFYNLEDIKAIKKVCEDNKLALHLDGARLFNAMVETGDDYKDFGNSFDTISICLSKGLGIPVGSVLIGTEEHIKKARRIRKVFGGGMRQAGFLAAAGIYALDNNISRLKEDHKKAKIIAETLKTIPYITEILPVETNIVIYKLDDKIKLDDYLARLTAQGVKASAFGKQLVRLVTHLDISDEMLIRLLEVLKNN